MHTRWNAPGVRDEKSLQVETAVDIQEAVEVMAENN